jgi:hypothetical protein
VVVLGDCARDQVNPHLGSIRGIAEFVHAIHRLHFERLFRRHHGLWRRFRNPLYLTLHGQRLRIRIKQPDMSAHTSKHMNVKNIYIYIYTFHILYCSILDDWVKP